MYIARILYPVEVLGPGKRVGIWFAGCPRRCKGCSNPELWERDERYHTSLATVMHLIDSIAKAHKIDGFTLTGGDPMLQYDTVMMLLPYLKAYSHDILVYTGYRYEELPDVSGIAALIDGEYIEERNRFSPLLGSDNQRLFILNEAYRLRYHRYLKALKNRPSPIQNFSALDGHISLGIHRPHFLRTKET